MGGAYQFSKDASANLRQKDDAYNSAVGGAFAGSMLGLKCASPCPQFTSHALPDVQHADISLPSPLRTFGHWLRCRAQRYPFCLHIHRWQTDRIREGPHCRRGVAQRIPEEEQEETRRRDCERAWRGQRYGQDNGRDDFRAQAKMCTDFPSQESPLPATRSAGRSASRRTTASTCRSVLLRRYVSYTNTNTNFLLFRKDQYSEFVDTISWRRPMLG